MNDGWFWKALKEKIRVIAKFPQESTRDAELVVECVEDFKTRDVLYR